MIDVDSLQKTKRRVPTTVSLPSEMVERLRGLAREHQTSLSELVTQGIARLLDEPDLAAKLKPGPKEGLTKIQRVALQALKELMDERKAPWVPERDIRKVTGIGKGALTRALYELSLEQYTVDCVITDPEHPTLPVTVRAWRANTDAQRSGAALYLARQATETDW